MKNSKRSDKSKSSSKKPTVRFLPSSNVDMENYIQDHRAELSEAIIDAIGYAVSKNLGGVEVFRFVKSNYTVLITKKDFKDNLDNIFNSSLATEDYELCAKIHNIRKFLSSPAFTKNQKSINLI